MRCNVLENVKRQLVDFDTNNPEHIKAAQMLCVGDGKTVRQHPTLRFKLEDGFESVRSMMFYKISEAYLSDKLK